MAERRQRMRVRFSSLALWGTFAVFLWSTFGGCRSDPLEIDPGIDTGGRDESVGLTCVESPQHPGGKCSCKDPSCACLQDPVSPNPGSCDFVCGSPSRPCAVTCPRGGCATTCAANTTCDVDCRGLGGGCDTQCEPGARCSMDCSRTGNCTMACQGALCTITGCAGECSLDCTGDHAVGHLRECGGSCAIPNCTAGNQCAIEVCKGGCSIDECGPGAICEIGTCAGGCYLNHCDAGSTCVINTCTGPSCSIQCAAGATCLIRDCPAGGCKIGCQAGATCTIEKCRAKVPTDCDPNATYTGP